MKFKKLLEPITIKGMKIKNRIVFPPLLAMPKETGIELGDSAIRWYESRAKGGTGLIITGTVNPSPSLAEGAAALSGMFPGLTVGAIHDDRYISFFKKLAKAIHQYDAKIGVQIAIAAAAFGPTGGPRARHDIFKILMKLDLPMEEVTKEQLEIFKNDIAAAAGRAKEAGIDFVELHCAHNITLHGAFLSPFCNKRVDEYGGSWGNRLRFTIETLEKMRGVVGEDYPLFVRVSGDENMGDMGITLEDTVQVIAPALEKSGYICCLDVSQGAMMYTPDGITIPGYYPRGYFMYIPEAVKKAIKLPVIGTGRIVDLELAEKCLREGKADLIALGRQLIADPETPNKVFGGRAEEVRKCIADLRGLGDCTPCTINYESGREMVAEIVPADRPKQAVIVGGGVAGMEAARVAALRGHKVVLIEKGSELGGMVGILGRTSLDAEFRNLVDYLSVQMSMLKVDVRICREADPELIMKFNPDVVILAIGSTMIIPDKVKDTPGVMTHLEALKNMRAIGRKVVIWGLAAGELAISLARQEKDVTLIGRGTVDNLAKYVGQIPRFWILRRLADPNAACEKPERMFNPRVLYRTDVRGVLDEGVRIYDQERNTEKIIPYDTLIVSLHRTSNIHLYEALQGKAPELYRIGDCEEVGDIYHAIATANEVARKI